MQKFKNFCTTRILREISYMGLRGWYKNLPFSAIVFDFDEI